MELIEAAKQGITCIRKPYWEPEIFIELSFDEDGLSAFAGLHQPHPKRGQEGCPYLYYVVPLMIAQIAFDPDHLGMTELADAYKGDDWEEYKEE